MVGIFLSFSLPIMNFTYGFKTNLNSDRIINVFKFIFPSLILFVIVIVYPFEELLFKRLLIFMLIVNFILGLRCYLKIEALKKDIQQVNN